MLKVKSNQRAALMLAALLALGSCGGSTTEEAGRDRGNEVAEASAPPDSGGSAREAADDFYLGKPRDDVERFFGLYGEPGRGQFFVTEAKRPKYAEQAPEIPPGYFGDWSHVGRCRAHESEVALRDEVRTG